jgi:hypothetical protein
LAGYCQYLFFQFTFFKLDNIIPKIKVTLDKEIKMVGNSRTFTWKAASLFVLIMIILAGCRSTDKVTDDSSDSTYFYGNWQNVRGSTTMKVTLSKESWVGKSEAGYYTLEQLSWIPTINDDPKTNSDYPNGYSVTGTASQVKNISDLKNGQLQTFLIYMNKDKTAILRKSSNSSDLYPNAVFTKVD